MGKWAHFWSKNGASSELYVHSNDFFKILHNEGPIGSWKISVVFPKKTFVSGKWTILDPKMVHPHNYESTFRMFLKIERCHWKGPITVDESNINVCYQNIFFRGKWAILDPKMAHPHNSGLGLRIFVKLYTINGAYSVWKLY